MKWGLSDYESRAYLALLSNHPLTAYETARKGGIPNPKIYDVMNRLLERGMVEQVEQEKKRYIPLEPRDFIRQQRSRTSRHLDQLEESLEREKLAPALSFVWNIRSGKELLEQAALLIENCRSTLLLSLWPEEYALLADSLDQAEKRGISLALVQFGEQPSDKGQCFRHPIADTLFEEKGGRSFALCADSSAALMGIFKPDGSVEASWSRSFGFTSLAEDYIRHDIYIMKIVKRFDPLLVERFGENYHLLRDVFHDKEDPHGKGIH